MSSEKNKLSDAVYDLKFLLNRGYKKKNAITFVANKYLLNIDERNYLVRKIFSNEISMARMIKILDINDITNKNIFVDGYNVLITAEMICNNDFDSIMICYDGLIRDLKAVFGNYHQTNVTEKALKTIITLLKSYNPMFITFIYDSPVSKSGELAKLTNRLLKKNSVKGNALTSKNVDFDLVRLSGECKGIVATSDGPIIDKVEAVVDIPYWICKKSKNCNVN
jgi:hypothetical protein